jgi:phosphonate transport system substrate-binding protein
MVTRLVIIGLVLVAIAGGGFYFYSQQAGNVSPAGIETYRKQIQSSLEDSETLHKDFTDKDGDLLADAPEAGKQLDPETLIFSPLTRTKQDECEKNWKDFIDHLAKLTGKKVEVKVTSVTKATYTDIREGKIHVLGLNTGGVSPAVNLGGFIPVAALAAKDGNHTLQLKAIVPASSPIAKLEDIKGKQIKLVRPQSFTGYKAPATLLFQKHQFFPPRDYEVSLTNDAVVSMKEICEGKGVVAFVPSDDLAKAEADGAIKADKFKVIYTSEESYPRGAYGYSSKLKPELAAKIKEAFTTFKWEGSSLSKATELNSVTQFVPVDYKKDFEAVRKVDEALLDIAKKLK